MTRAVQVDIEASPRAVWQLVADAGSYPLWMPEIARTEPATISERDASVGTRFRLILASRRAGKKRRLLFGEVRAHAPCRLHGFRLETGRYHIDVLYTLTPMGTGTRLSAELHFVPEALIARLLAPFVRRRLLRLAARHLTALKRHSEDVAAGLEGEG